MKYVVNADLLIKYFMGLANPDEVLCIDEWRIEKEENEHFYAELWHTWSNDLQYKEPDVTFAWQQFQNKINFQKPQLIKPSKRFNLRWLAYAAILILVFGIGLWQFNKTDTRLLQSFEYSAAQPKIKLQDGVYVTLNNGANLKEVIVNKNSPHFVLKGNANFDFEQSFPAFKLQLSSGIWLRDIGTEFEIINDLDSALVTVKSGIVEVWNSKEKVIVAKNKVLKYNKLNDAFLLSDYTGNFNFEDITLQQLSESLALYFNTKMLIDNTNLAKRTISLTGNKLSLSEVLDIIKATLEIDYDVSKRDTIIFKNK